MIGVQAAACFPIAEAFLKGQGEVKEWPYPIESNLSGICDPLIGYPRDGTLTRGIITHSGGLAVAVTDDEANRAAGSLARDEGIYCEPTAAAALRGNQVE